MHRSCLSSKNTRLHKFLHCGRIELINAENDKMIKKIAFENLCSNNACKLQSLMAGNIICEGLMENL